jgi:RNA polymerase sigma-70 factor, ECF subfamily
MNPQSPEHACDDLTLINLVQAGDQRALVALYDRYSAVVYNVALRILRDVASAEDVLQEIFVQVWRSPFPIKVSNGTLHGWMLIASRNRAISVLRKNRQEPLKEHHVASPSNIQSRSEQRMMCDALMQKLNAEQQKLLHMAFLHEKTHAEIAVLTGLPLGTIKTRIRTALIIIRESVAQSTIDDFAA